MSTGQFSDAEEDQDDIQGEIKTADIEKKKNLQ